MNSPGILYSVFVCLTTGLTSVGVFYLLSQKKEEEKVHPAISYFCLLLGLLWISVGLGALFTFLDRIDLRLAVHNFLIGPLTYLHVLPTFYYFGWSFFSKRKKVRLGFYFISTILVLASLFSHFIYEPERIELGYWGDNIVPHPITSNLFTFAVCLPAFVAIFIELIKRYREWQEEKTMINKRNFGFSLGFLAYAVTGVLESQVFTQGWPLLLARIGVMIAPLVFFFFSSLEEEGEF